MATPAGEDLFGSALQERLARQAPLAARLRPSTLDEMVGQEHLLGPNRPLRGLIEAYRLSSVILWGPPGTGKTTLARLIAGVTEKAFETLSAVSAGVKDVREVVERARRRLAEQGQGTILFLDEVHRFNRAQQDVLLPWVEEGVLVLVGATTENPYFEVNAPLLSRSSLFRLEPLDAGAVRTLLDRGLAAEGADATADALDHLVDRADGDGRVALNALEVAVALARARRGEDAAARPAVTLADAEAALSARALRYERDEHYDVISAFIKSLRGSDPDAGLYWLARMLEAGEDARFIARRMVILASEDVGMADPTALLVADAAARAVEFVGLPEAQLNLAHAVVYLATAPKSNRVTTALGRARSDVLERPAGAVPAHLRDASYRAARKLGHGVGYEYPHDDPRGWVPQQYRPPEVAGHVYYEPSAHGAEEEIGERMRRKEGP
ncbi:MAG TPA: replication-associated recombination protein A [Acidimicrobiales bacterium]|nr:replication-associated recombination protein A [Acidimicrobiales bacterium]